ncbi:MAG: sulfatase [Planctomycetota bacterium]
MPTPPPNILYLHCHDAGRYVQPHGHPVPTPSLQRLAEEGVLFRQAFTPNPTCSPSRACLLTGQYAHVNGMLGLAHRGWKLNDYSHHLIHSLHDAGYTSALAGMQHIAKGQGVEPGPTIGYHRTLTLDPHFDAPTDAAIDFLHEDHDRPFFLALGYFAPHRGNVPHRPTQSFPALGPARDERYVQPPPTLPDTPETRRDFAEYTASMQSTDLCFGRVLEALDRTGLADNTLVIATTDHGVAFPHMKCRLTDYGTGVMLILRGPRRGFFRGGKVVDAMVSHLDVFPTVCELAGVEPPDRLHGKSLRPLVTGEADALHDQLFAEVNHHAAYEPMRAVRSDRHKYIRHFEDHGRPVLPNCDDGPSKTHLVARGWDRTALPREELYDLTLDPTEARNLADDPAHAATRDDLRARLDRWMSDTDDPLLQGPIPLPAGGVTTDPAAYSPDGSPAP